MDKPIYEIPISTGINGVTPVPPPNAPSSGLPSEYGPPPGTPTPESYFGTPSAASYAPPAAPSQLAPPSFTAYPPPAHQAYADTYPQAYVMPPVPAPAADYAPNIADMHIEPELASADPDLLAALIEVVRVGASDLHVSADAPPMVRINGSLRPVFAGAYWDASKARNAIWSSMNDEQRAIFEKNLELDYAVSLTSDYRYRVNVYQQREAIGAAFRLIPTEIKTLKQLGIPERVGDFSQLPRGLVLVTGPTGSGKSTTLAALIDLVNQTRADHIVTVEDPIEFMHVNKKALINQREVGSDTHSFASALKHVLRQDPDVILIGELRDLETISVALTAAETGHLVFATLHTQDAAQTVDRVIDVFPPHQQPQVRAQLSATLQGVVCQTLVKNASGGRVVAAEIMVTTPAIANLIREGKTFQIRSNLQAGRSQGMQTMDQHLADLVNSGEITHQAAYDKAQNAEELRQLIRRPETASDRRA